MFTYLNLSPRLPEYSGIYKVGTATYEVRASALSQDFERDSDSTIKFRLFYPTDECDGLAQGIPWLPEPQNVYLDGYLRLGKAGRWLSVLSRAIPWGLRSAVIPAYENAPMCIRDVPYKVLVFSHGLVGGLNTHSAILGELASNGVVCVAIEHRDGSAPVTLVKNTAGEQKGNSSQADRPIYFKPISFEVKAGVLEQRDEQLRERIFELTATFRALEVLNAGQSLDNLASVDLRFPTGCLDLRPGTVSWAGHSFGGTTITQLMKSIVYFKRLKDQGAGPLLITKPSAALLGQILPSSPMILLDPWFMPLKSPATKQLYSESLPCHAHESKEVSACTIMSSEFAWHWPEHHSHMPAILSSDPVSIKLLTQEEYDAQMAKYRSPRDFINDSQKNQVRFESLRANLKKVASSHVDIYVLRDTTHTTFTDFGVLFPWISYMFTGQRAVRSAVDNVVRCVLKAIGNRAVWDQIPSSLHAADIQLEKFS